jgi:branched-subunit amino acid aminotransferase/4-amino-4-deoxychorismate lyase
MDDLLAADEAFLASTTREVQPVAAVDDHRFDCGGEVTHRIAAELSAYIRSELNAG